MTRSFAKVWLPAVVCLLALIAAFLLLPADNALAGGTKSSDRANTLFVYGATADNERVLLKAIPFETIAEMAHGIDREDVNSTYYHSYMDSMPAACYKEGVGITIDDLLAYVQANSTAQGADQLTFGPAKKDALLISCCDTYLGSTNFTYAKLADQRYYFPNLYTYWNDYKTDYEYIADEDPTEEEQQLLDNIMADKEESEVYLAIYSLGGRVFENEVGSGNRPIYQDVAANNGVIKGCLTQFINEEDAGGDAFTFCFGQTENDIITKNVNYNQVKKWVYAMTFKPASDSPIVSAGTVAEPECIFSLEGNTLTITLSCDTEDAELYYSTIGGETTCPVNKYSGPIVIEDYDTASPFDFGYQAVKEGYVSSSQLTKNSNEISDSPDAPAFVFALSKNSDPEVGSALELSVSLTADKDCPLYGVQYRLLLPANLDVNQVTVDETNGWGYGIGKQDDKTAVTITYLDITGQESLTAGQALTIATVRLTPNNGGDTSVQVESAVISRDNAISWQNITAEGLQFTVSGSAVTIGDLDGDTEITSRDAMLALRIAVGLDTPTAAQTAAADLDGDGYVTSGEAARILRFAVGLIDSLI